MAWSDEITEKLKKQNALQDKLDIQRDSTEEYDDENSSYTIYFISSVLDIPCALHNYHIKKIPALLEEIKLLNTNSRDFIVGEKQKLIDNEKICEEYGNDLANIFDKLIEEKIDLEEAAKFIIARRP